MRRHKLLFVIGILLLGQIAFAQSPAAIRQYVATYKDAAIQEMKRSGVPASITLAQGIHETVAGTSDLVLASNNHFGIKCKSDWQGDYVLHDDDAKNERFRKYESPVESYKDHSDFLLNGKRYAFLFQLDPTDYRGWAYGLKKAGYATNPRYPQILIKLIEDYNLEDYTLIAMGRKAPEQDEFLVSADNRGRDEMGVSGPAAITRETSYPTGVFRINDTKVVFVPKGTSYLAVAEQYDISLRRLFEFNDMQPQDIAAADGLVYLQRKRRSGANEFHKVNAGESLYSIAQAEGIRMENLLDYNLMKDDMQPMAGETLYLQKSAPSMPRLAQARTNVFTTNTESFTATTAAYRTPSISQQIATSIADEDAYVLHRVQPKETMYSIAKKYAVSMNDVLKWNDLQTPELKVGQELRINKRTANNATN